MHQPSLFALVAAILGSKAIEEAQAGKPAQWATKLASIFGGKKREAVILSYALGAVGIWIGLKSMNANRDYLGSSCDYGCGCGGNSLF